VNPHKPWVRLCRQAKLEGVRLHDLRHTYASMGATLGLSLPILGKLLGHQQAATTQRYAHLAPDPYTRQPTGSVHGFGRPWVVSRVLGCACPPRDDNQRMDFSR